jgi:hypothetical protein
MTGVLDVQGVIVCSKAAALARAVAEESKATAATWTQAQREAALLSLVLQDIGALVPVAAQARTCSIVFERQRSGVLFINPAEVADITPNVVALYDAWFDGEIAKRGRETMLQASRDRLDAILKAQPGGEETKGTGHYL